MPATIAHLAHSLSLEFVAECPAVTSSHTDLRADGVRQQPPCRKLLIAPLAQQASDIRSVETQDIAHMVERKRPVAFLPEDPCFRFMEELLALPVLSQQMLLEAANCLLKNSNYQPYFCMGMSRRTRYRTTASGFVSTVPLQPIAWQILRNNGRSVQGTSGWISPLTFGGVVP